MKWLTIIGAAGLLLLGEYNRRRVRRRAFADIQRAHGRGAALRWDAGWNVFDRARIDEIRSEIEVTEGVAAADEFQREVEEARAKTTFWQRPRGWGLVAVLVGGSILVTLIGLLCFKLAGY